MYLFHKRGDILKDINMTGSLNPKRVFELFSYKIAYAKEHPEELRTTGIRIFLARKVQVKHFQQFNM